MSTNQYPLAVDSVERAIHQIETRLSEINATLNAQDHESFLGVSWDILLPTIISILVFILGYYISSLIERRKIQKGRNLVRDTIVIWVDSNTENLAKYVKSIKKLAEDIGSSDNLSPKEFNIHHITIDVLSQFSIDRLTDALVSGLPNRINKKGENLNSYLQSVSYIIRIQNLVLETYERYCSYSDNLFSQWSAKWRAFSYNCNTNNMRLYSHPDCPEKTFYLSLAKILKGHLKDDNFNFGRTLADCDVIKGFFDSSPIMTIEIMITRNLFEELYGTMIQVDEMKQFKQSFLGYAERIEAAIDILQKAVKFYREHKMKYCA